jgi:hypothetical protein
VKKLLAYVRNSLGCLEKAAYWRKLGKKEQSHTFKSFVDIKEKILMQKIFGNKIRCKRFELSCYLLGGIVCPRFSEMTFSKLLHNNFLIKKTRLKSKDADRPDTYISIIITFN